MQNSQKPNIRSAVRSANVVNQSHTTSMSCLRASISEAAAEKIVAKKPVRAREPHAQGGLTGVPGGGRRTLPVDHIDSIALTAIVT